METLGINHNPTPSVESTSSRECICGSRRLRGPGDLGAARKAGLNIFDTTQEDQVSLMIQSTSEQLTGESNDWGPGDHKVLSGHLSANFSKYSVEYNWLPIVLMT